MVIRQSDAQLAEELRKKVGDKLYGSIGNATSNSCVTVIGLSPQRSPKLELLNGEDLSNHKSESRGTVKPGRPA
jgi:hypothetical protein